MIDRLVVPNLEWIHEENEALRTTMRVLDRRLRAKERECFELRCLIEKKERHPSLNVSRLIPPDDVI
jgi:hypothetical protein